MATSDEIVEIKPVEEVEQSVENMYPTDGTYFGISEPEEQAEDRSDEENKVASELPIMQEAINYLKERQVYFDSASALPAPGDVPTDQYMAVAFGNQNAVTAIKGLITGLENLISSHITDRQAPIE